MSAKPAPESSKKEVKLSMAENFCLSGAAAIISKTIAAPIERVKLMVQNQGEMLKNNIISKPYKNSFDCFRRTFQSEGLVSFWRGNSANVIRYFPTQALNFAFKDKIKLLLKSAKDDNYYVKFSKNILSGGLAGSISLCFVYSLDYARTRLANDAKSSKKGGARQFNGLFDVYRKTMASDGIVGLYRGFAISITGIMIYRGFYFGLYDTLKPMLLGDNSNLLFNFLLGYVVTMTAGLLSYPVDTIRRRMMMTSGTGVNYSSSIDCARKIWRNEGATAFMKGATANILRGVAGAAVLALFDEFKKCYVDAKSRML
ncbi:hypothetical protein MHBO_001375 [Bonamia ostreae]|uniref:ADP/ATP translocase n=1 Tax=Bonamia ostreae TaxID=126728 RepID=A0ABV2AIQ8_9EUKA